jgi:UDP-4-amino-4,6-dideoxy-N-acetyl-beta-L-altrosamine N-acetyltransferase
MIVLHRFDETHLGQAFKWRNDPLVYSWCRQHDVISSDEHSAWFNSIDSNPKIKMFAIVSDKRFLGVCGLTDIDHIHSRAEFSLYVGPEHQKQGFGTSALTELLSKAFRNFNLNQVWGETVGENPAQSLFTKVGMTKEGTRRQFYFKNGEYVDSHIYAITRNEFWSKHGKPG